MPQARISRTSWLLVRRVWRSVAALVALLAAAGSASADCTCRAGGRDYRHGERVCLSSSAGPRTAMCGMDQNVASWILLDEPCAVSARPPALRLAGHLPPPR